MVVLFAGEDRTEVQVGSDKLPFVTRRYAMPHVTGINYRRCSVRLADKKLRPGQTRCNNDATLSFVFPPSLRFVLHAIN